MISQSTTLAIVTTFGAAMFAASAVRRRFASLDLFLLARRSGGPKNIPMLLADLYGPLPGESAKAWLERNYLLSYKKLFNELERILDPAVLRESGGEEPLTSIITPFLETPRPRSLLNKLMAINIRLKGANLILVKVDKMTSANGVLALPPLFTRRVVEASMSCPPGLKLVGNIRERYSQKGGS